MLFRTYNVHVRIKCNELTNISKYIFENTICLPYRINVYRNNKKKKTFLQNLQLYFYCILYIMYTHIYLIFTHLMISENNSANFYVTFSLESNQLYARVISVLLMFNCKNVIVASERRDFCKREVEYHLEKVFFL